MDATRVTAALELLEVIRAAGGQTAQYFDVFAPGAIDLHVIRGLKVQGASAEEARGPRDCRGAPAHSKA